ncbi:unnamed protein product [Somion occarium]
MISSFATVLTHPHLAVHIRHIDIRAAPSLVGGIHPQFVTDSRTVISSCDNLVSFVCIPNLLMHYLSDLESRSQLHTIRVRAQLHVTESGQLLRLNHLRTICLDTATWNVVHMLPTWTQSIKLTLRTLTLYALKDLNDTILEAVLKELPDLTALHIVFCPKIDYGTTLRLSKHTPALRSLAFSCWTTPCIEPSDYEPLPHLRHLAVDIQCGTTSYFDGTSYASIFTLTRSWGCTLHAITVKLSTSLAVGDSFMKALLRGHGSNLAHLSLINCMLLDDHFRRIVHRCKRIERLSVIIPHKNISTFAANLSRSSTIHTLQDVNGALPTLSKDSVRAIMVAVTSLTKVVTPDRIWTNDGPISLANSHFQLIPEKRRNSRPNHWFVPPT